MIKCRNLSYLERKVLRKKIWEKAKKKVQCPYCKSNNGPIKKTGFLRIIHEKYKNLKKTDPIIQEKLSEFNMSIDAEENYAEFRNIVEQNYRTIFDQVLTPDVV